MRCCHREVGGGQTVLPRHLEAMDQKELEITNEFPGPFRFETVSISVLELLTPWG
jgi:hypothetical protein